LNTRTALRAAAIAIASAIAVVVLLRTNRDNVYESPGPSPAAAAGSDVRGVPFPPPPADQRPPVKSGVRQVELCGYGPVTVDPEQQFYPAEVKVASDALLKRVAAAMSESADPAQRAAAGVLRANMRRAAAAEAFAAKQPRCADSNECWVKARDSGLPPLREEADRLATDVAATRDARAFGIAYQLCREAYPARNSGGPCGRLSAEQWAQLEPDNVVPWLFAASRSRTTGDATALIQALRSAAATSAARTYWMPQLTVASHATFAQENAGIRLAALMDLIGPYANFPIPDFQALIEYCPAGLSDEHRRKECGAIASALVSGTGLLELSIGSAIGRNAGWPVAQVEAVRQRADAIKQAGSPVWDTPDYWSCERLKAVEAFATTLAAGGEVAAGELAIKASGRSVEELSTAWRERMRQAERNFLEEQRKQR
jgi:hypothetical protein